MMSSGTSPRKASPNEIGILNREPGNFMEVIRLCLKHNQQILSVLKELSERTDVTEILQVTRNIESVLNRISVNYASLLDSMPLEPVEIAFHSICEYEKKIQQLKGIGVLARYFTQSRLRSKIDQLCTNTCVQVETLEREIRENVCKMIISRYDEQLGVILESIEKDQSCEQAKDFKMDLRPFHEMLRRVIDKECLEKIENQLSIATNPNRRKELLQDIPRLDIRSVQSEECSYFGGSQFFNDEKEKIQESSFCVSTSTYPRSQGGERRDGDPICDTYCLAVVDGRPIAALADGCGWGNESKEASRKASRTFCQFLRHHLLLITDTKTAARYLLYALHQAHKAILHGRVPDTLFMAGTTTLVGGLLLPLTTPYRDRNYIFLLASIGDCKAYHYDSKGNRLGEITKGNRGNYDMRDPGGRIGPFGPEGQPNIDNLRLYCQPCQSGDFVSFVSDGIHDNLNPRVMGKIPSEVGISVISDWEKLAPEHDHLVLSWQEDMINQMLTNPPSLSGFSRKLIQHSFDVTAKVRKFMEDHPGQKVRDDYRVMPGKTDHCSIVTMGITEKKTQWAPSSPRRDTARKTPVTLRASGDEDHSLWNRLFGQVFVKEWKEFIGGLGIRLNAEDEDRLRSVIDHSRTGSVTRYKFQEFLKGFGPLERCVANVRSVVTSDWFHGFISSNESKHFLLHQPVGVFLIRFSESRPGSFVLDYVSSPSVVRSVRLTGMEGGEGFEAASEGQGKLRFASLHDLVHRYTDLGVLTTPFSTVLTQKNWFFGDLTSEEAEELLTGQPEGTFLIRFSNQKGCLAASFVGGGVVKKGLIVKVNNGFQVNSQGQIFDSLDDLVIFYQNSKIFHLPYHQ